MCAVAVAGRQLLASASVDETVRIWDPATGASLLVIPANSPATAICITGDSLAIGLEAGVLVIKATSLP